MKRSLLALISPQYTYPNHLDQQKAQGLLTVLILSTIGAGIYSLLILVELLLGTTNIATNQIVVLVTPIITGGLYLAVQNGWMQSTILALIGFSVLVTYPGLAETFQASNILAIAIPIVVAGVLLSWRGILITFLIVIATLTEATFISSSIVANELQSDYILIIAVLSILTAWLAIFSSSVQGSIHRTLEGLSKIRYIAELNMEDLPSDELEVISKVLNLLHNQFGYAFAQVFLTSSNQQIQRKIMANPAQASEVTVESDMRINPSSAPQTALTNDTILHITQTSTPAHRSHLLPGIQHGLVIPVKDGQKAIGILDIQFESDQSLGQDDIDVLQLLARQLGTSINRVRHQNRLETELNEQTTLINRQQEKLQALERTSERATTSTWTAYLQERGLEYLGFDLSSGDEEARLSTTLPETLHPAFSTGSIQVEQDEQYQTVSVPIRLRGQTLGALSFKVANEKQIIGGRQKELIRSVVQRLGLALENKRLFERSQSQAQRERMANEVGSLLLTTTDIETVLQLAATNFNEALGAVQTQIHLQSATQEETGSQA